VKNNETGGKALVRKNGTKMGCWGRGVGWYGSLKWGMVRKGGYWYEKGPFGTFLFGKRTNAKSSNGAGLRDENISNI